MEGTMNIADLLLMACANALLSFCIFFFWYYAWKDLDQLVSNLVCMRITWRALYNTDCRAPEESDFLIQEV